MIGTQNLIMVSSDRTILKEAFLLQYRKAGKDAEAKKFELRMIAANLKQEANESSADYLKKASELARNIGSAEIDVDIATVSELISVSVGARSPGMLYYFLV